MFVCDKNSFALVSSKQQAENFHHKININFGLKRGYCIRVAFIFNFRHVVIAYVISVERIGI